MDTKNDTVDDGIMEETNEMNFKLVDLSKAHTPQQDQDTLPGTLTNEN
jgi:branched-subunit amino acid aminotransferase/4-amino-4-deoxychorismate lyase